MTVEEVVVRRGGSPAGSGERCPGERCPGESRRRPGAEGSVLAGSAAGIAEGVSGGSRRAGCPASTDGVNLGGGGEGLRLGGRRPLQLSLVAFLLMLWATPSLGGMCWTSKTKSGHCKELISHRIGREDCCSAGGATTAWSAKELDPGSLFFWRALGGGVPCQACKETCTGVKCGEGKRCIIRKGRPKCACALDCRHGKGSHKGQRGPVCGSDSRSYSSVCRLRKRSCRKKSSDLTIAYYGHCQRSCDRIRCPDGKQCLLDQRLTPHCVKCRRNCPLLIPAPFASTSTSSSTSLLVSSPASASSSSAALAASATARHRMVCGVDGVTYLSACHLREAACRRGKAIPIAYKGRCKKAATCRTVHCREGQSCLTEPLSGRPRCVTCNQRCPRNNRRTTAAPSHANSSAPPNENGRNATLSRKAGGGGHNARGWSSWGPLCGSNDQTYDSWCQMLKDACATGFVISTKYFGSCDDEGDDLKKKWKNLRDSYAKHLRAEKTHTGQQAKGVVRYRAWPWALQMEFLRPFLQFAPTDSNVSKVDMVLDGIGEGDTSASEDRIPMESPGDENDTSEEPISPEPTEDQISCNSSARKPSKAQKRRSEETSSVSQVIQYFEKRRACQKFESCDEIDLVCMGYARTIKKFKPRRQAIVKFKISELLMKEELAQQEEEDGEHL